MSELLDVASALGRGIMSAADLARLGINSHTVHAMVTSGRLVRIRQGMYVDAEAWKAADRHERYRRFVRATAASGRRPAVVSHLSAAAMHRLPVIGSWPTAVHVIDPEASGGSHGRAVIRHRHVAHTAAVEVDGIAVTPLLRTLIDVAATSSFLVAVTMIDHVLHIESERAETERREGRIGEPPLTPGDLLAELAEVRPRGWRQASRAIGFANGLAANPGESMSRVRIFELGFEVPELQVHFFVEGRDYWVDYFWRGIRKIGEFDGKQKYTRGVVLGDRDPGEVVWEEKRREDALRRHVNSFSRWDWETAISPRRFYDFLVEQGVPRA